MKETNRICCKQTYPLKKGEKRTFYAEGKMDKKKEIQNIRKKDRTW